MIIYDEKIKYVEIIRCAVKKLNSIYDRYGIGTAYQIKTDDIGVNWLRTRVGVMAGVHPAIRQLRLNRQASSAVFQLGAIPELLGPQEPLDGFL